MLAPAPINVHVALPLPSQDLSAVRCGYPGQMVGSANLQKLHLLPSLMVTNQASPLPFAIFFSSLSGT